MLSLAPIGTLARAEAHPMMQTFSMAALPLASVLPACRGYMEATGKPAAEAEAVRFYTANHAFGELGARYAKMEPIQRHEHRVALEMALQDMASTTTRIFFYLLLICVREARHVHHDPAMWSNFSNLHGAELAAFVKSLRGNDSDDAVQLLFNTVWISSPTLGRLVSALRWVFYNGQYGHSYGGLKWGAIADVLGQYVDGEISALHMVDTAWTLAHNTGPIFNKGMVFSGYTQSRLIEVLDVQRAGQMPAYAEDGKMAFKSELKQRLKKYRELMAWTATYVDWYAVEAAGAVESYAAYKAHQSAAHPSPEQLAIQAAAAKAAAEKLASAFEVMPGLTVYKVKR